MIQLTPAAVRQVIAAAEDAGIEEPLLRVAARSVGEDGDVEFGMGFDERREQDEEVLCYGVTVLVSPPSRAALEDVILDYVELSPGEFHFVFGRAAG